MVPQYCLGCQWQNQAACLLRCAGERPGPRARCRAGRGGAAGQDQRRPGKAHYLSCHVRLVYILLCSVLQLANSCFFSDIPAPLNRCQYPLHQLRGAGAVSWSSAFTCGKCTACGGAHACDADCAWCRPSARLRCRRAWRRPRRRSRTRRRTRTQRTRRRAIELPEALPAAWSLCSRLVLACLEPAGDCWVKQGGVCGDLCGSQELQCRGHAVMTSQNSTAVWEARVEAWKLFFHAQR